MQSRCNAVTDTDSVSLYTWTHWIFTYENEYLGKIHMKREHISFSLLICGLFWYTSGT